MATANWYINNASRYFVLGTNKYITQEDIDMNDLDQELLGEYDYDKTQWDYDDQKAYLIEELEQHGYSELTGRDRYNSLDRDSSYIARQEKYFEYAGVGFYINIKVKENAGYYEGSCLDFEAELSVVNRNGYDVWQTWEMNVGEYALDRSDVIDNDFCSNIGLSKIQAANIIKHVDNEFCKLVDELELIFSKTCEYELYKAYQCSNGEAGYGICSDRLYERKNVA